MAGRPSLLTTAASAVLLLLILYTHETSAQRCPTGWRTWRNLRNDCYYFSRSWVTWEESRDICESHGGVLASIRNQNEFNRLSYITRRWARRNGYFVGFNEVKKATKTAKWIDGTPWTTFHTRLWARGEPNNAGGKEFCGELYGRKGGKFNDIPCTGMRRRFICRRPRRVVEKCDRSKGWIPFQDRCIRVFEGTMDWRSARSSCQENAGDLLVINSTLKLNILKESVICRTPLDIMWIGLSDVYTPGTMQWIDGSEASVANWFPREPRMKARGNTCTEVVARSRFRWRNNDCAAERKYICEKSQGQCPEGWKQNGQFCYKTYSRRDEQKTWIDAVNFCEAQGANLMKVHNRYQQNTIIRPTAQRLKAAGLKTMYIGASDRDHNGEFRWTDRSDIRFKQWKNRNQPRYYPNKWSCGVVLTRNRRAKWVTRYCFVKRPFICQKRVYAEYTPPTPTPTRACYDSGWQNFKDKCYFFSDYSLDWTSAQQECSGKWGANLATIDNPELQSFISNNLAASAYVGLNNRGRENLELRWIGNNGQLGKFLNWALWHPVLGVPNINCVNIRGKGGRAGTWRTFDCRKKRNFICEKGASGQIVPGTTPATMPWSDLCGPGWIYDASTDFCYFIVTDIDNFFRAEEACKKKNGELASIGSKHEQMFVNRIIKSRDSNGAVQFWIGANNLKPDAGWMWTDFSAFGFFNWNPGMPDSRDGANCVKIETTLDGRWTTDKCSGRYPYICKKNTDDPLTTVPPLTEAPPADCPMIRMVSGKHYIQDAAMTASSQSSPATSAANARIVPSGVTPKNGWEPQYSKMGEWLQLDFMVPIIVKGIVTKGMAGRSGSYVTSYKVLSLYDQQANWIWYSESPEDGASKLITGNTDSDSEVTFMFKKPFQARFLRIMPVAWNFNIGLRVDILGCIQRDCRQEGVITGDVRAPDNALSASSTAGPNNRPAYSRINGKRNNTNGGSWTPIFNDQEPWIQADLGRPLRVRSVVTKGRDGANEWVTDYELGFSSDGTTFTKYMQPYGTVMKFQANNDSSTPVQNYLTSPIVSRYIRLYPKGYMGYRSLRWEVYACITECVPISLLSGDSSVGDWAFSASSELDGFSSPSQSRLNTLVNGNLKGAWSAEFNDNSQYIQADLGTQVYIVGVATQGRDDRDEWVSQYILGYSHDGKTWYAYFENGERKLLNGNWDRNTTNKNYLSNPFSARYVRLYPQANVNRISLRWELYGCPGPLSGIHAGCYGDAVTDPDMSNSPILSPTGGMTARICINHCFHQGYLFAGIRAGDTCHCGNNYGKHGTSTSCTIKCAGDREDTCGGNNANSVYNTGIGPTHKKCPPGWLSFKESCYLVSASRQTFDEAIKICKTEGAHLVSVEDMNEMDFVTYIVEDREQMWLGLNDRRLARTFEWEDGTPVVFTNWNIGQPSNWASRDTACVSANAINGRWSGESCSNTNKFLCEKPKESSEVAMTTQAPKGCPRGWSRWYGSCYLAVYTQRTWAQSAINCKTMGAQLVRIKSREEMVYVRSRMTFLSGDYWTDLSDVNNPGTYTWSDGTAQLQYTNWGKGQPDSSKGACVALVSFPSLGRWFDRPCNSLLMSICKRPQEGAATTFAPTEPAILDAADGLDVADGLDTADGPGTVGVAEDVAVLADAGVPAGPGGNEGPDVPANCPAGWLKYGKNCFLVINKQKNEEMLPWPDALSDCRKRGADLASFHSQEELNFIWTEHIAGAMSQFWIGLNTRDQTQGHEWSDLSAVDFTFWAPGEPNSWNNVENCVEMYRNDGKWNDLRCDIPRNWICKAPAGTTISDLSTTAAPLDGGPGSCASSGGDWRLFDGTCYFFTDGNKIGTMDWRKAEQYCKRNSGNSHLASIHSQRTLNFMKGFMVRYNMTATSYWIGLNELDLREGYKWVDQTPVDFVNWGPNEPNADYGNEPCIALRATRGEWHNMHCADRMGFICSRPADNTPAPPTQPPINGYCPTGFVQLRNKCFKFVDPTDDLGRLTMDGARNACIALGRDSGGQFMSDIASIDNAQEQAFVTAHLMGMKSSLWIGLYQPLVGETKRFVWASNTPVTYTEWRSGQPTRTVYRDRNCVAVDTQPGLDTTGKWFDTECWKKNGYICMTQPQQQINTPPPTANPCPRDYVPWRKSCYLLLRGSRGWRDSDNYCKRTDANAQLVTISDIYEQAFVYSLMNLDEVGNDVWTGLSDFFSPGVFQWSSKWPVAFTSWGTMQPTRAEGGCVAMDAKDGMWKDIDCQSRQPSICEVSQETPPPTPSPVATGVCPPDDNGDKWMRFGRSCFLFMPNKYLTYKDADYECVRRDSQLTSVHSPEEHEFIASTASGKGLWIGFHKSARQSFVWRDDSVVDFVRWNSGEPSDRDGNANENCVELWGNGNWNDVNCYNHRGFICRTPMRAERSTATIPYQSENINSQSTPLPSVVTETRPPITQPPITLPPITLPPRTFPPVTFPPRTQPPWPPRTQPSVGPTGGVMTTKKNSGPDNVNKVGVQTSGGEIAAIVILLILLIVVVVGAFMLFRHTKAKQLPPSTATGFDNAMYNHQSDELQLETAKDTANGTSTNA